MILKIIKITSTFTLVSLVFYVRYIPTSTQAVSTAFVDPVSDTIAVEKVKPTPQSVQHRILKPLYRYALQWPYSHNHVH